MAPAAITAATPATGPRDGSGLVIGLKPGAREGATKLQLYGSKIPSRLRTRVFRRPALTLAARPHFRPPYSRSQTRRAVPVGARGPARETCYRMIRGGQPSGNP